MYTFKLTDIIFAIKSLKAPSSIDISKYLSFTTGSTRSAAQGELKHVTVHNKARHLYFNRLWNALPPIDLSLLVSQNRTIIYKFCGHTSCQILDLTTLVVSILFALAVNAMAFLILSDLQTNSLL